jgi:hypothetical protein
MPRREPEPPRPNEPRHRPDLARFKNLLQREDLWIAAMAGMLAYVITLALKMALSG